MMVGKLQADIQRTEIKQRTKLIKSANGHVDDRIACFVAVVFSPDTKPPFQRHHEQEYRDEQCGVVEHNWVTASHKINACKEVPVTIFVMLKRQRWQILQS
jgi:hypothetical protein